MKIELKNTDFKVLYEWLIDHTDISTPNVGEIIHNKLKPQYHKAFLKHKNEKQAFKVGEIVRFRFGTYTWEKVWGTLSPSERVENNRWLKGKIHKVYRWANGQYSYVIKYKDTDGLSGEIYSFTNPMTKKNIKSI